MASNRNALNKPISTQACWRKSDKFHFIYIETFYGSFVLICCRFQRPSFFGDTNECLGQAFWFLLLAFFSRECWVFFLPAYFQAVSHFWVPFLFLGLSLIGAFPIFWFAFFPARFVLAFCHLRSSSFGGFLRQNALSGRNKDIWQKCSRTIFFRGICQFFGMEVVEETQDVHSVGDLRNFFFWPFLLEPRKKNLLLSIILVVQ